MSKFDNIEYLNQLFEYYYPSKPYSLAALTKKAKSYYTPYCYNWTWDDLYSERDTYRKYGYESYGIPKVEMYYKVFNEHDAWIGNYTTEKAATDAAESMAKSNPGRAFYVLKPHTKSYVAPAPAITTRL